MFRFIIAISVLGLLFGLNRNIRLYQFAYPHHYSAMLHLKLIEILMGFSLAHSNLMLTKISYHNILENLAG